LIGVFEFESEGESVRIIKMRNPWGSGEWKGEWSDKSDRWTPELKKMFNWKDADDGEFFMAF
jgi:calpain-15